MFLDSASADCFSMVFMIRHHSLRLSNDANRQRLYVPIYKARFENRLNFGILLDRFSTPNPPQTEGFQDLSNELSVVFPWPDLI